MELFGESFVRNALAASVIAGGLCAFLGVYVVLRRIVLLGIALSEISAPGVAAGFFLGFDPTASSLALAVAAVLAFWLPHRSIALPRESVMGFAYVLAASLAIILVAKNPAAESRGFDIVSGNLLYADASDVATIGVVAAAVLALHLLRGRTFIFASFDPETARAAGVRVALYDLALYLSLGISIAVSMKIAGVLFVFGSLVVPPMTALALARRMPLVFAAAVLCSVAAAIGGIAASIAFDWPAAPAVMTAACALFAVVAGAAFALRRRR